MKEAMKHLKLALWLFVFGVSFGVSLNSAWLLLAGLLLPIGVCSWVVARGFFLNR